MGCIVEDILCQSPKEKSIMIDDYDAMMLDAIRLIF